jgi:sulfur-carrier protein
MTVKVHYTGQLRTALGRSEDDFEVAQPLSLPGLLEAVAVRVGDEAARHVVTPRGDVPPGLIVVVNGGAIAAARFGEVVLKPGDVITLLPPIAGG